MGGVTSNHHSGSSWYFGKPIVSQFHDFVARKLSLKKKTGGKWIAFFCCCRSECSIAKCAPLFPWVSCISNRWVGVDKVMIKEKQNTLFLRVKD